MIEVYLRIETWQKVQIIENKLEVNKLYAPFLRMKLIFCERSMTWEGQIAPASQYRYDVYRIERRVFRWALRTMLSVETPRLWLGKYFKGGVLTELSNDVRYVINRGNRNYIMQDIKEETV